MKIIEYFKGVDIKRLAAELGTSTDMIYHYTSGHKHPRPTRAKEIERLTNGKVPAAILIFGPPEGD
jgi:DNA-binding transcriptional regulator YdaS (Cro superfamily)